MIPFSVLDLAPVAEGGEVGQALRNARDLAQHAETWGYKRFWVAEHHNMPGVASAATAVLIGFVADGTKTIRVGAGGIMLPNHAPLVIAEQFGTLAALYPGRIDLGLGRAPGTDQATARALRRTLAGDVDRFPNDVVELIRYFEPATRDQRIEAVPGAGQDVKIWILGSSLFGAQFAAALGVPFAFASHFAPAQMLDAIALYRQQFEPSRYLDKPYVMLGFNIFAADTEDEAKVLATSMMQAFLNIRRGERRRLPPPIAGFEKTLAPMERETLAQILSASAIGDRASLKPQIADFIARTKADELMITSQVFDHQARLRSFEIAAEVRAAMEQAETHA